VASSLGLGLLGTAIGWQATRLLGVESARGTLAAWLLVAFGVAYAVWGARRAVRRRRGIELHDHGHDGDVHLHDHGSHGHGHAEAQPGQATAFWTLFVVFVLGPCEPMIPLLVAPAGRGEWTLVALLSAVFLIVTVAAMLAAVTVVRSGLVRLRFGRLERWSHALAGGAIAFCGAAVILLGV
jgi:ABC-type nickel/cobalt efflux system permease component RcnA